MTTKGRCPSITTKRPTHKPSDHEGFPQDQGAIPGRARAFSLLGRGYIKCAINLGASAEYGPTLGQIKMHTTIFEGHASIFGGLSPT
jgi:hypothetical protein